MDTPYAEAKETCSDDPKTRKTGDDLPKVNSANSYTWLPKTVDAIKQELLNNGPVTTAMTLTSAFYAYDKGVLDETLCTGASPALHHSVIIVGWGVDCGGGSEYWILKNSWGDNWGENGFGKVKIHPGDHGYGVCLLHYYAVTINLV